MPRLALNFGTVAEAQKVFDQLAAGGKVLMAFAPSFWCIVQWINGNWRGSAERGILIGAVILYQSVGAFYGWLDNRDEPESKTKSGMKSALNIFVCAWASIIGSLGVGILLIIGGVL